MDGVRKKLISLAWLIREHREAVELELIRHGERLRWMGSGRLSWRDVWVICTSAPPKSPLAVALNPRLAWDTTDYLLADLADSQRWLVWSKTRDGQRNRNRPKPIPRPGVREVEGRMTDVRAMSVEDMKAFLARRRVSVSSEQSS